MAFDLGSTTGFAIGNPFFHCASGTIDLKRRGVFSPNGFSLFQSQVNEFIGRYKDDVDLQLGVEKPHCGPYFHANHILFGLLGILEAAAQTHGRKITLYSPATIKKFWTGNGRASKVQMVRETRRQGFGLVDHNQSDAIALFYLMSGAERV